MYGLVRRLKTPYLGKEEFKLTPLYTKTCKGLSGLKNHNQISGPKIILPPTSILFLFPPFWVLRKRMIKGDQTLCFSFLESHFRSPSNLEKETTSPHSQFLTRSTTPLSLSLTNFLLLVAPMDFPFSGEFSLTKDLMKNHVTCRKHTQDRHTESIRH